MKILFDGIPLDKMSRVDDDERRRAARAGRLRRGRRGAGRRPGRSSAGPSRTTSSRSSWSATPTSTRPSRACGSWPTSSSTRREHMPRFNSISISGYHMQEAGATADAGARVHHRRRPRVRARRHRPRASTSTRSPAASRFFFAIGMNFFMEVAKLRAARLLWAPRDAAVRPEEAAVARCCARTARRRACRSPSRTRTTTSCAPPSRRWPRCSAARRACTPTRSTRRSALPTEFSARIARNTQLILAEETGITHVVDPLGGSYYVEALTHEPGRRGVGAHRGGRGARRHDQGGRVGHAEAAHRGGGRPPPGRASTAARRSIVGVNKYRLRGRRRTSTSSTSTTPTVREQQIARLARRCAPTRDDAACQAALDALTEGARGRRQPARAVRSTPPAPGRPSARSPTPWKTVFGRHRADDP